MARLTQAGDRGLHSQFFSTGKSAGSRLNCMNTIAYLDSLSERNGSLALAGRFSWTWDGPIPAEIDQLA